MNLTQEAEPVSAVASTGVGEEFVPSSLQRMRFDPPKPWQAIHFSELWRYRELVWFLTLRDIKVRYKQTALGAAWAIIQPVLQTLIFVVMFYRVAGLTLPGIAPYAVNVFGAILMWQLFETSLTAAGNSLVGSQNLITKVYFPRLVIPVSAIGAGLLDFAIGFVILIGAMVWYRIVPSMAVLTLPLFILLTIAGSLAVGMWLSALNVQYRDVRYAIPFLARVWFFATPILYDSHLIGKKLGHKWEVVYGLNPMAGIIEGFRWAMFRADPPSPALLAISAAATLVFLVGGLFYFRKMEQTFADIV